MYIEPFTYEHYSFLPQEFFALLTKNQLVGYYLLSLILLIITAVTIVMDTPDKKIPKSTQPRVPDDTQLGRG